MSDYTLPSEGGFIALYSEYLSLRSRAAKGRATRQMLLDHAKRLGKALLTDAKTLGIAVAVVRPECSEHSRAWAALAHPLERHPKDKVMRNRKWSHRVGKGIDP